jgi:serine O-acetyltransferase
MFKDPDFKADLLRYPKRPFLTEQSIWAIYIYRYGRRVLKRHPGVMRSIQLKLYWAMFRLVETITGISLPLDAQIGPGLRIHHFGNIFVHSGAVIGCNCTLRQGVTIGNRLADGPAPVLEDDVDLGAYAQILGGIRIHRGAKIGAMSVVLQDVPAGATATGVAASVRKLPSD